MSQSLPHISKADSGFDPLSTDFASTANSQFARMRRAMPVYKHGSAIWPFISLFRYSDIKEALGEPEVWSSDIPSVADLVLGDASILIQDDPPLHTHRRSLLLLLISALSTNHQDHINNLARELFEQYANVEIDFTEQIAAPLAINIVCGLLGLPKSEHAYLREWTNRFSANVGSEFLETDEKRLADQRYRVGILHKELSAYLCELRATLLKMGGNGLLHDLEGTDFAVAEQVGILKSLLFAGNHSSAILQTNAAWLLATHPEERRLLQSESSIDSAMHEILRHKGTFRGITRRALNSGHIGNVPFDKGDYLIAWLTSGNRDEDVFKNPDAFDIMRSPNHHITFGHGPHQCIGANLAKMELRAVLRMLSALAEVRVLADPSPIPDPWVDGFQHLEMIYRF